MMYSIYLLLLQRIPSSHPPYPPPSPSPTVIPSLLCVHVYIKELLGESIEAMDMMVGLSNIVAYVVGTLIVSPLFAGL